MNVIRKISIRLVTTVLVAAFVVPSVIAQSEGPSENVTERNAVEEIEDESAGNVEIIIPEDILELLLTPPSKAGQNTTGRKTKDNTHYRKGVNRVNGFRIMVFSDGRNPSTLKQRARARGNAVAARFPKYRGQVYTYSKSPNWYCTIGNFRTSGEATKAMSELRRAFPSFGSEMRVVKSHITIR